MSSKLKVKFGKEVLTVDFDAAQPVVILKAQLQSMTNVPADGQKLLMANGKAIADEDDLAKLNLNNKTVMLMGSAVAVSAAPEKPVVFAEDVADKTGHDKDEVASNGLVNVGNTCYLDSALQTLRFIPELRPYIARSKSELATSLNALYKQLDGTKDKVSPDRFVRTFWKRFPQYAELSEQGHLMQHDSQEVLANLVETIEGVGPQAALVRNTTSASAGNDNTGNDDDANATPAAPPKNAFGVLTGLMKETTTNKTTGEVKEETNPFLTLSCDIPGDVQTIEQGIEKRMDSTTVVDGPDGQQTTFTTKQKIVGLPQYLFVHLHRFTWRKDSSKKAKILRPVAFPMVLDVSNFCDEKLQQELKPQQQLVKEYRDFYIEERKNAKRKTNFDDDNQNNQNNNNEDSQQGAESSPADDKKTPKTAEDRKKEKIPPKAVSGLYELCAIISHKGRDAEYGHYVAWIKKAGHWLVFDDENVSVVSEEDVKRLKGTGEAHIAYLMLYRAFDPESGEPPLLI